MTASLVFSHECIVFALHLLVLFVPTCAEPFTVTKFERDSDLDDYYCVNDVIRAERDVSLVECLRLCRSDDNDPGASALFQERSGVCQCHRYSNTAKLNCTLSADSGFKLYKLVQGPDTFQASSTPGTTSGVTATAGLLGVPMTQAATTGIVGVPLTQVATTGIVGVPLTQAATAGIVGVPLTQAATTGIVGVPLTQAATMGIVGVPLTQAATTGIVGVPLTQVATAGLVGVPVVPTTTTPRVTTLTTVTTGTPPVTSGRDGWDFRLVNGTGKSGRLEVSRNGTWGVVYGFSFSVADATIMCRDILQLGTYGFPIYGNHFGVSSTAVGLSKNYVTEDWLICYPDQTCDPESWQWANETEFREFGTVGLDCTDEQIAVQLADGNSSSGRLEVKLLNQWGTVCGDSNWQDGPVYCRYFGLNYTKYELSGGEQTSGPIWIHGGLHSCDNGNETSPEECVWSPYSLDYFSQNCNHTVDVILYCQ